MTARILVVDDDPGMCEMLDAWLRARDFATAWRTSAEAALALLRDEPFDVVVTDLNLGKASGVDLCARVIAEHGDVPVIVITAFGSLERAIELIRAGAFDILAKPFEEEELVLSVERALQQRGLRAEVQRLNRVVSASRRFEDMLGASLPMRRVYDLIDRVADADAPVLIEGESGTGKELAARALHARGARSAGPFVAVNCAAIPEALLESELFGHVRGAFTDAREGRPGLFVAANGGTLFLDEIGELPLAMQPKLLRALEMRTVRPVGGSAEVAFDVNLVTATNRDIESMVDEKRFREDLFYRINVVRIEMPPLRARGDDILLLAEAFLERVGARGRKAARRFGPGVAARLLAYAWPGNVRELVNCVERAVAVSRGEEVVLDDLPARVRDYESAYVVVAGDDPSELVTLEEVERRYVQRVLSVVAGNKALAARILGLDRKTLYRRLERYGKEGDDRGV